jgi:hypothetical protein
MNREQAVSFLRQLLWKGEGLIFRGKRLPYGKIYLPGEPLKEDQFPDEADVVPDGEGRGNEYVGEFAYDGRCVVVFVAAATESGGLMCSLVAAGYHHHLEGISDLLRHLNGGDLEGHTFDISLSVGYEGMTASGPTEGGDGADDCIVLPFPVDASNHFRAAA